MTGLRNIVILTGAGVSAESGLQTFRASDGLWEEHRVEDVASPEGFAADPALVHRFYNQRRARLAEVEPNAAHLALAELERHWEGDFLLVTQNIDDLHERAGSQRLIHMHGELLRTKCNRCGHGKFSREDTSEDTACRSCRRSGFVRPDVVWFGEVPYRMDEISSALRRADLFVSIGTSGNVYPAAGCVAAARQSGAQTLELNLEPSLGVSLFHEARRGKASELVPALVAELLGR